MRTTYPRFPKFKCTYLLLLLLLLHSSDRLPVQGRTLLLSGVQLSEAPVPRHPSRGIGGGILPVPDLGDAKVSIQSPHRVRSPAALLLLLLLVVESARVHLLLLLLLLLVMVPGLEGSPSPSVVLLLLLLSGGGSHAGPSGISSSAPLRAPYCCGGEVGAVRHGRNLAHPTIAIRKSKSTVLLLLLCCRGCGRRREGRGI